jgi:hypothetical protein
LGSGVQKFGYAEKVQSSKTLEQLIDEAEKFFAVGAYMLMVESEGIPDPKN